MGRGFFIVLVWRHLTGGTGASEASETSEVLFYFFLTFPPSDSSLVRWMWGWMNSKFKIQDLKLQFKIQSYTFYTCDTHKVEYTASHKYCCRPFHHQNCREFVVLTPSFLNPSTRQLKLTAIDYLILFQIHHPLLCPLPSSYVLYDTYQRERRSHFPYTDSSASSHDLKVGAINRSFD